MSRRKFKYYFLSDPTTYYKVSGGVVTTTSTPTPVQNAPIGWKDTALSWKRNEKYHGVFRNFAVPLAFVNEGADILRYIYYTQGVEGRCTFLIEQQNVSDDLYAEAYRGDIDFSQVSDTRLKFQAAILDAGLAAILKGKSNTPYEIPILNGNSLEVFMDGILLRANAHYVVPEQGVAAAIAMSNTIGIFPAGQEGINAAQQFSTTHQALPATLTLSAGKIYTATYAETATVRARFTAWVSWPSIASSNVKPTLAILHGTGAGTVQHVYQAPTFLSPGQSASYVINNSVTVSLAAGDSIAAFFLMLDNTNTDINSSASRFRVISTDGTLDISSDFTLPATIIRAMRRYTVFQNILGQMAPGYGVVSNHLTTSGLIYNDAKPYNVLLTSGDAVRGLGDGSASPAKIKTTLDELHQDGSAREMEGIGVEGDNVRIERLDYFYDKNTITLEIENEVSNFTISPASEYLCNQVKVGYISQTNDNTEAALNGRDDFNTTQTYASEGIRVKSELDLVTPYAGSMYVIEYLRANLAGKNTTDSKSDNETFLLEVEDNISSVQVNTASSPVPAYKLSRKQNDPGNTLTGLISAVKAFNVGLTSKRNLLRNGPRVHIPFHLQDGTSLKFQTTDKNDQVVSNLGSGTVTERADVPISSLPDPLFLPIAFEFETASDVDVPELIAANPYGLVRFRARNRRGVVNTFKGFISDVSVRPADNGTTTWRLLAAPDTNLDNLI